jgi:hypothetical protein
MPSQPKIPASVVSRVAGIDWNAVEESLSNSGYALTPRLLSRAECEEIIGYYDQPGRFRSHIVMARFGFGRGEYKYFKSPLPPLVREFRAQLYPRLAVIANRWAEAIGGETFPRHYSEFLAKCHASGQNKPTPLVLKYAPGDFNCLHQDLYGEIAFPFQMTFFLSPAEDYTGGEFVLVEQRPRMQSRVTVVPAAHGSAVIFPTRYRAVRGTRGMYRANLRHGVSPLHSGSRFTLGIIFHDAK